MPIFKFEANTIRCKKTTREFTKDEIYMLAVPIVGSYEGNHVGNNFDLAGGKASIGRPVLSEIKTSVSKGDKWNPGIQLEIEAETDQSVHVAVYLFEKDRGAHYAALGEVVASGSIPRDLRLDEQTRISAVALELWDTFKPVLSDLADIAKPTWLIKVLGAAISFTPNMIAELGKDDYIDDTVLHYDPNSERSYTSRVTPLTGCGGVFEVTTLMRSA